MTRDESGFRHLLRVRLGVTGAKGTLYHCTKRDGSGKYWKVKLDPDPSLLRGREWAWPEDLVIDGIGESVTRCGDCGLRFISDGRSPLCPACAPTAFGAPSEIRRPSAYLHGARMSTAGATAVTERTPDEQAQVDAEMADLRRRDEQMYPF